MLKVMGIASAAVMMFASPAAAATRADIPPPDKITINVVTVNGSGCPAGTAALAVSPDNTAFTVTYSNYVARVGPGASTIDWRKNCQINLRVNVPQGFTYAIAEADYRGFASLAKGASGLERANYYFQGMSPTSFVNHTFPGGFNDSWESTDTTDIQALVYAPCGEQRLFNINTELRVNQGTSGPMATSFMSMDSTDGSIKTTYRFRWKECP
jgi:hypothetical protein